MPRVSNSRRPSIDFNKVAEELKWLWPLAVKLATAVVQPPPGAAPGGMPPQQPPAGGMAPPQGAPAAAPPPQQAPMAPPSGGMPPAGGAMPQGAPPPQEAGPPMFAPAPTVPPGQAPGGMPGAMPGGMPGGGDLASLMAMMQQGQQGKMAQLTPGGPVSSQPNVFADWLSTPGVSGSNEEFQNKLLRSGRKALPHATHHVGPAGQPGFSRTLRPGDPLPSAASSAGPAKAPPSETPLLPGDMPKGAPASSPAISLAAPSSGGGLKSMATNALSSAAGAVGGMAGQAKNWWSNLPQDKQMLYGAGGAAGLAGLYLMYQRYQAQKKKEEEMKARGKVASVTHQLTERYKLAFCIGTLNVANMVRRGLADNMMKYAAHLAANKACDPVKRHMLVKLGRELRRDPSLNRAIKIACPKLTPARRDGIQTGLVHGMTRWTEKKASGALGAFLNPTVMNAIANRAQKPMDVAGDTAMAGSDYLTEGNPGTVGSTLAGAATLPTLPLMFGAGNAMAGFAGAKPGDGMRQGLRHGFRGVGTGLGAAGGATLGGGLGAQLGKAIGGNTTSIAAGGLAGALAGGVGGGVLANKATNMLTGPDEEDEDKEEKRADAAGDHAMTQDQIMRQLVTENPALIGGIIGGMPGAAMTPVMGLANAAKGFGGAQKGHGVGEAMRHGFRGVGTGLGMTGGGALGGALGAHIGSPLIGSLGGMLAGGLGANKLLNMITGPDINQSGVTEENAEKEGAAGAGVSSTSVTGGAAPPSPGASKPSRPGASTPRTPAPGGAMTAMGGVKNTPPPAPMTQSSFTGLPSAATNWLNAGKSNTGMKSPLAAFGKV